MIDSGALFYERQTKQYTQFDIIERQLDMLQDLPTSTNVQVVQLDQTMLNKSQLSDRVASLERNLLHAYEYKNLLSRRSLPPGILPMGVIQGYDLPSITYTIHELKKMGYQHFGVGSLLYRNPKEQIAFIRHAVNLVGSQHVHVFGVTGLPQIKAMLRIGVASLDSSRPTMAAAFYQVFYSQPFRTYVLDQSRVTTKKNDRIQTPLPCDCPVCQVCPEDILIPSPRHYMKLRSIHNYYHLLKTIHLMKQELEVSPHAVPNVLRP